MHEIGQVMDYLILTVKLNISGFNQDMNTKTKGKLFPEWTEVKVIIGVQYAKINF